jgi:hypothetical protein
MADKKTVKFRMVQHAGAKVSVQLNIDRDSNMFWADVFGTRIEHKDGSEAERLIKEAIDRAMAMEWTPLIVVSPWDYGSGREYAVFGFSLDRVYYADLPNGVGLRKTRWDAKDDKQRLSWSEGMFWRTSDAGAFKPPCVWRGHSSGSAMYYLPYSEPAWERLCLLQRQIRAAHEEFKAILGSADALRDLAELRAAGLLALPEAESVGDQ